MPKNSDNTGELPPDALKINNQYCLLTYQINTIHSSTNCIMDACNPSVCLF